MAYFLNSRVPQWPVLYVIIIHLLDSVCGNIRYSIPEELELGAFVGNIATDLGLDVKQLFARRFRIVSENKKQYLDVNLNTGVLFIKQKMDREQLCEQGLTCVLIFEAVIENPLKLYRIEIEILDVNDNAPVFQKREINIEIPELVPAGTTYPLQSAIDPDAGTNSIRSYELSPNEHFTLKSQSDSEQTGNPELVLERPIDREQQPTHRLTLTAFDGGNPDKFGTAQVIITVLDANDNAPVCDQNVYQIIAAENVSKNTIIVKVTAVDMDEGLNGEVIYSFSDHTPDKVRELFSLDSKNGEIRVTGSLDFEEAENYQISVQAKDRGLHAVPVYCKVILQVTDVNDNFPEIMITSASNSILEDAAVDTAVAVLRVTDRDFKNRGDVYCRIPRDIPFKLTSSFNNYYTLVIHGDIDREKAPEYNITITCSDTGSPPLSTNKTIRVHVSDINDNTPRFTQPSFTVYVTENNVIGASIGSTIAFDPDSNQNAQLSYSIFDSLVHGLPASTLVSINSANGVMFAHRSFDYEQFENFQVHVQVKDAGSPPLSSNVTVNVIIVDQNDNAPVIVSPLPSKDLAAEDTIPRSADSGYLVAKVTATDADSGQNAQLSYQLRQPTDESLFTVAPETGEIWTIRRLRHKDSLRQKIVILVRDNGTPSLSATVTINVSVQDDTTENASNIGLLGTSGPWESDLKFYLIILFGTTSFILFLAIIILGIKVHRGRNEINSCCCCWNTPYFPRNNSLHGIQKANVNLQIPPNYKEVYDSESLPQPFRYDVCPDSAMNDFMFLKLNGAAAPMINIKTGTCVAAEHGKASNSPRKDNTEFHEKDKRHKVLQKGARKKMDADPNKILVDLKVYYTKALRRMPRGTESMHQFMQGEFKPKTVTGGLMLETAGRFRGADSKHFSEDFWRSSNLHVEQNTNRGYGKQADSRKAEMRAASRAEAADPVYSEKSRAYNTSENLAVIFAVLWSRMAYLLNSRVSQWPVLYVIIIYVSNTICGNIRYSIPEELELGAFVGNIATDLGLDMKQLLARRFRIVSENKKQFLDVNLNTGILFTKAKIDREQLCEQGPTCVLMLEAVIENPLKLNRVEIQILDVNDNAPVFQRTEVHLEIPEATPAGTTFPLLSALDPDIGTNSVRSYQLSPNEHFTLKSQTGSEQTGIPELVLERPLDREHQAAHQLTLTAFDGGNPEKFGTTQIIITVLDVNDNIPVYEQNIYQVTTAENVPTNTLIVKVNAVDMDEGLNGEVIYSFSDHTPHRVRELFSLDSTNGEIRVTGIVDFEEAENYQISVQAKDRGPYPVPAYCKVLVKVTDINDNPPEIITTSTSSTIPEDASLDTAVALFRVTDRDSENTADVYCRIPRGSPFKLNGSFNNYYTLVLHGDIDRENVSEYNITILCTDTGSPPLSTNKTIRVQVSDINDNTPQFTQPSFTMYVTENNVIGYSIGSVKAFDPDSNQNAQITFDILDNLIHGLPASTFVSINSANGAMIARRSFDYEQIKTFKVHVQVRDAGSPPLSSNVTVNVIIVDQNDNAPVIVSPLPSKGSIAEETIPRSADSGYLVAKVTATDADSGQNAQLSYELRQPTDESLFTTASETGEIWIIRRFGYKDSLMQKIVILVRDNGTPSLSVTAAINISVQDDDTENAANISRLGISGIWKSDLKLYLIISFGTSSFLLLVAIVILGIKVHRGRNTTNGYFCCWNTSYLSRKDSFYGTQKTTVNHQIPPNFTEVYESETLPPPFRYEVCPDSAMNDFMFLKLHGAAAPMINIKTGSCVGAEYRKASNSTSKETTEFHEIYGNRQWDLEHSSIERCSSGQYGGGLVTSVKSEVEPDPRRVVEIHSHAL
ncbi:uncharacterized protein [Heptranchias perlo]|uniref:uncharacterized protein n=1 Tax=Heptranchias perlo TaxID=212740 RepID=UPI0035593A4D